MRYAIGWFFILSVSTANAQTFIYNPIIPQLVRGSVTFGYGAPTTDGSITKTNSSLIGLHESTAGGTETSGFFSNQVDVTGATGNYEKMGLYARITTADPSTSFNLDAVANEAQAVILAGNTLGRAWSYDGITKVQSGADGYAIGAEYEINNNGSDQPALDTTTSKVGLHLVCSGSFNCTALSESGTKDSALWDQGWVIKTTDMIANAHAFVVKNGSGSDIAWFDVNGNVGAASSLGFAIGNPGSKVMSLTSGGLLSSNTGAFEILAAAPSGTAPAFVPNKASTTTGIGAAASGSMDLIAGGTDMARVTNGHYYGIGFGTVATTETGYVCYNSGSTPANEFLLDTTACLSSLEEFKNIKSYITPKDALSDVMKLKPFWYTWNQKTHPSTDKHVQPGLGAHAVEKVDARLSAYDAKGHLKGVRYEQTVAVLVAAIQEQQREIDTLKKRLH